MIIVRVLGGLGNQMFQYAYARSLKEMGYEVKLDTSFFIKKYRAHGGYWLDRYNIDLETATTKEIVNITKKTFIRKVIARCFKLVNPFIIKEESLLFSEQLAVPDDNRYIIGYFQNEKYFPSLRQILLKQFSLKEPLSENSLTAQNKIKSVSSSVSLHIRRGDYLALNENQPLEYYKNAVKRINQTCKNNTFFIFSDDIEWAKENLDLSNVFFIENTDNKIPQEDIYLMSLCQHNIISNSTFSWWSAWLNQNKNKIVIAPKNWSNNKSFNETTIDLVPKEWLRV